MKQQENNLDQTPHHSGIYYPRIYVAAPFFSEAESNYNLSILETLKPFFSVFLPQTSGYLMSEMIKQGMEVRQAANVVYQTDIKEIQDCDILLIVLNGRAIDEGAAFELGYARAIDKPCFALQTDTRLAHAWGNNPMIAAAVERTFTTLSELQDWASRYHHLAPT